MGIFFRKPKTEGALSAVDERRIQNLDTSKIPMDTELRKQQNVDSTAVTGG